jgi:hypothetical protein
VLLGCFTAVACAICQPLSETISFDYRGVTSVNGYLLDTLQCVKDTQIDFNFPQAAIGSINITTNPGATGYKDLMLVHRIVIEEQRLPNTAVPKS